MSALPPDMSTFLGDLYGAVVNPNFLSPLVAVGGTLAGVHMTNRHHDLTAARKMATDELTRERGAALSPLSTGTHTLHELTGILASLGRPSPYRITTHPTFYSGNLGSMTSAIDNLVARVKTPLVAERVVPFAQQGADIIREATDITDDGPAAMAQAASLKRRAEAWLAECPTLQRAIEREYDERLRPYLPDGRPWPVRAWASMRARVSSLWKRR